MKIDLDENVSLINCRGYHPHAYCSELNLFSCEIKDVSYFFYITKLISNRMDYIQNETGLFEKLDLRLGFSKLLSDPSFAYAPNLLRDKNETKTFKNCEYECALQVLMYTNKSISSYIIRYPLIDESRNETNTLCVKKLKRNLSTLKTTTNTPFNKMTKTRAHYLCLSDDPVHIAKEKSKIENKRIADIDRIKENTKKRIEHLKNTHKLGEYGRKGFAIIAIAYLISIVVGIVVMDYPKLIFLIKNFKM